MIQDPHLNTADTLGHAIRTTVVVTAVAVTVAMPTFLVAASAVFLRVELGFDESGLGLAISVFFAAAAAVSVVGGRWAERFGAGRSLFLTGFGSGLVLLCLGLAMKSFVHLVLLLALGGALNGFAQPAANLALARDALARQGLMFGVQQSAFPLASLLAGASVPLVGAVIGWRATFIAGAALAVICAIAVPWDLARPVVRTHAGGVRSGDARTSTLVTLAVTTGAATAAAVTLPSFLVESAITNGIPVESAGWLLVVASIAGVCGRLTSGWAGDRQRGRALYILVAMLVVGAGGYILLAVGGPTAYVLGALTAYFFGWGWPGLLLMGVVRLNPNAPAAAIGIVLTGGAGGAAIGPFVFGLIVARSSFYAAWMTAGLASVVAAVALLVTRSSLSPNIAD